MTRTGSPKRAPASRSDSQPAAVLLVQCCHPAQFLFVAREFRRQFPQLSLDALIQDHPQMHYALENVPTAAGGPLFDRVFSQKDLARFSPEYDRICFPLLSRGYGRLKLAAWKLPGEKQQLDDRCRPRPISRGRLLLSIIKPVIGASPEFLSFLQSFPEPPLEGRVLLVESCQGWLLDRMRPRVKTLIDSESETVRVGIGSSLPHLWWRLRKERFDGALLYFSGESGYASLKLLPFLLRVPKILVLNEHGIAFYAGWRQLVRFLMQRLLRGTSAVMERPRILLIQTETAAYLSKAAELIRNPPYYPQARMSLLCREEDRHRLCAEHTFETILTFQKKAGWKQVFELRRQIRRLDPDIICGVFTGRPVFRKQKLFLLLSGRRRLLAFNAALDSFWITPRSMGRLVRRETLIPELAGEQQVSVLFIPTETDEICGRALQILTRPNVVGRAEIQVLCSVDRAAYFRSLPGVSETVTYSSRAWRENLFLLRKLFLKKYDVVSAIFTDRPIFRRQKPLFFLIPARARLVFNDSLDCFFLNHRGFSDFWKRGGRASTTIASALWLLLKGALFLPRFLYLLIWVTWQKLRRARA